MGMAAMSDAPEILWAEPDGDTIIIHNGASNLEALIATGYLTKYIRADLMAELVEVLQGSRETILQLVNSRGSEAEGTDEEWASEIDAALAKIKGPQT